MRPSAAGEAFAAVNGRSARRLAPAIRAPQRISSTVENWLRRQLSTKKCIRHRRTRSRGFSPSFATRSPIAVRRLAAAWPSTAVPCWV